MCSGGPVDAQPAPHLTVFVAGATGYTGQAVVAEFAARGGPCVAHVRPDSSRLADFQARFAEVDTTPWTLEAMTRTLARLRPDVVFALLGTTKKRADGDYESVDYGLSVLLIDACLAASIRPTFVYVSAVGVGPRSRSPYMAVRWRVETRLRGSGLPFVIARPSFITGSDRDESRPMERLGAVLGDGVLSAVGALGWGRTAARYSSMTAGELAAGLVRLAYDPSAAGGVFEGDALRASG